MEKIFLVAIPAACLLLSACDEKGVCIEHLDPSSPEVCHDRKKSDCEKDNGTFHSFVKAPSDDSDMAKSAALQETCTSLGYSEVSIPGVYERP